MGLERRGVRFLEDGKRVEIAWPLLYADDLVLCGELEVEVCRRRGLKVNAGKSKVMVMNGEDGVECEVSIDVIHLEHVLEFKYLRCVLRESGTYEAEFHRKVVSEKRVEGTVRSLVNARDLQHECTRVLHETLLMPVLMYGSETMLWREKDGSRVRAVQVDNLRGFLGIRKMGVSNALIRELCRVMRGGG